MVTIHLFCQKWGLLKFKQRQTPINNFQKVQVWEWKHQEKMSYLLCFVRNPITIDIAGKAGKPQLFNHRSLIHLHSHSRRNSLGWSFGTRVFVLNLDCLSATRYIWLGLASGLSHLSSTNGYIFEVLTLWSNIQWNSRIFLTFSFSGDVHVHTFRTLKNVKCFIQSLFGVR